MQTVELSWGFAHVNDAGPKNGPVLMFANSLGTDLRVWDPILPFLPAEWRIVRWDKRGHGLSDCSADPWSIDDLAKDAAEIAEALGVTKMVFVGLSIGGLIGQALAHARPDLVHGLVLMDTAAKIGDAALWKARIGAVEAEGIAAIAEPILDRWFAPEFREDPARLTPFRRMLITTPARGYIGCCAAIAAADYRATTAGLSVPGLALVGEFDGSTPPALVAETAALFDAPCVVIDKAGHLPCVEQPEVTASHILRFLKGKYDG